MTVMAANPSTEPCRYCTATPAELDSQMALVTELAHSRVFLVRDQTHPGRCVVLLKRHARELFELAPDELAAFMAEVARVAQVVHRVSGCDKLNYAVYGDLSPHLHVHIVPKWRGGAAWGEPFVLKPAEGVFLAPEVFAHMLLNLKQGVEVE